MGGGGGDLKSAGASVHQKKAVLTANDHETVKGSGVSGPSTASKDQSADPAG